VAPENREERTTGLLGKQFQTGTVRGVLEQLILPVRSSKYFAAARNRSHGELPSGLSINPENALC
jgi:hypothetical protein